MNSRAVRAHWPNPSVRLSMIGIGTALILAVTGGPALAAAPRTAATPQGAALGAVYAGSSPVRVVRVNVAGRYATVLMTGALMENSLLTYPVLVERFSFGWQALDTLTFRCSLTGQKLGGDIDERLMRGMPKPKDRPVCSSVGKDGGPTLEVEALRRESNAPLTPSVVVADGYGVLQWAGAGGGQALFQLQSGRWKLVQGGGGALDSEQLREFHVPEADWCEFGIGDAHCPIHE